MQNKRGVLNEQVLDASSCVAKGGRSGRLTMTEVDHPESKVCCDAQKDDEKGAREVERGREKRLDQKGGGFGRGRLQKRGRKSKKARESNEGKKEGKGGKSAGRFRRKICVLGIREEIESSEGEQALS